MGVELWDRDREAGAADGKRLEAKIRKLRNLIREEFVNGIGGEYSGGRGRVGGGG